MIQTLYQPIVSKLKQQNVALSSVLYYYEMYLLEAYDNNMKTQIDQRNLEKMARDFLLKSLLITNNEISEEDADRIADEAKHASRRDKS